MQNIKKNLAFNSLRLFAVLMLVGLLLGQMPLTSVRAAGTDLTLTKTIEGGVTTAKVGDVIRYRIHFACSNLTTPCGPMRITDVLDPGVTYVPAQSSVPAGFTMVESPVGTITITKLTDLLDGSQYDAVIAVLVKYDLRPLPTTINNTVTGQIDPTHTGTWEDATPSSAPPITITGVTANWAITKTLSSPTINPTVDTDVTYQINLCPTTTSGNVALSNISMVDTLPTGAAFVSASNSGVYASGPGTVTWSVAGPVYPPNCVTRFVTIRYNSPSGTPPGPFNVGDNLTNNVNFNADYTPSTGTCTSPCLSNGGNINHDIDPIAEVPNYSKNDTGDPVGIDGTGRFILNLDTNDTNYPSNKLILIDNLPPQLQVTSVTSGTWGQTFDYVRAHVEYSTNNGSSYTEFVGSPVLYNTDATFSTGLPANITNVRWRFEYDPDKTVPFNYIDGLPYTWSFGTSPQIIVKPRAASISTDPPTPVSLPAAVAGNTYTNCLQTTRTDSTGTPVVDSCDNETMTVEGNLVSLRTSKGETPGMPWDDLSDPTILTFTPDTKILPGDTVRYTVTLELTERSSEDLVNPTIQDTLPGDGFSPFGVDDFIFVRNGTATLDGGPVAAPIFTQAGQVLTWHWNSLTISPLSLGSHFLTVEFYGYIPRGQDPGTYTNDLDVVTDSSAVVCEIGTQPADSSDIDTDGDTSEFTCHNPDTYVVERSAALRGEKWIRSTAPENNEVVLATTFLPDASCPDGGTVGLVDIPTNPFTRYPCISQAFPEGALSAGQFVPPPTDPTLDDFEYNLRIFNDGNVPMLKYVLYDILPRVGDTGSGGTLTNAARSSEFRPAMTGPIQFIQGPGTLTAADFTIEYNLTTNPCRPEVFDQPIGATVPGGCDNIWAFAGGVTDWTLVRSYRIRLNNDGSATTPSIANAVPAGSELRFGVPMHILSDAPPTGFDGDDALSHEIAWNSFAHVGSYDKNTNPPISIEDLLASEPRKVGITVPERMSVGNRVWRDADNNGTINSPDDSTPGIANVTVNLYRDTDNDGIADGAAISTTLTDTEGYYLFSNIPYDSANMNNNRYIIGIPASNFGVGQPLESLRSSTGAGNFPTPNDYTNPPSNGPNSTDHGIDPVTPGLEVFSANFILQPTTEPVGENDLSNNNRDGLPGQRRGVNGERDANSDLTLDFGFFGGIDVPFSIGNHVWYDNGQTGAGPTYNYALRNDGIRQSTEPVAPGVLVRLYRDGDANGIVTPAELIRTDTTDANGFYLFDNLDPGPYYVEIPASNFAAGQPLAGWYSSQPTGTETVGVNGGITTADIDNDDNGINNNFPEINGIFSGLITLTRGTSEPTGETFLSGEVDPGSPANQANNPTGWDGPGSLGRFGETDATSNLTIDFGFIPPMSLGNRVWIDEGAGTIPFRAGFNNALQDGTEVGISGVTVQLWRDTNGTPGLQVTGGTPDTLMYTTTTDASGYYLFDRLYPTSDYFVHIPAANFTGAGALVNYFSSTDASAPADDAIDKNDNGIDNAAPATNGISSPQIAMAYNTEPLTPANETDIPANTPANIALYGTNLRGLYGQADEDSNLTMDFGFVHVPRSIGNRLWIDANNSGVIDGGETPVPTGVRVSLYQDSDGNGVPDDFNGDTVLDGSDALGFDLTDVNGYYLFDKLPPGRYVVGVDYTNFAVGGLLEGYASSSGLPRSATYINPPITNPDNADHGIDRLQMGNPALSPYGILSASLNMTATPVGAPTGETGSGDTSTAIGFNPTAGDGPSSLGRYGETDGNSNLTVDFGFFIPMSIGNRVFKDDGTGGGIYNNGIMDGTEVGINNVRVELWRDANTDGQPDAGGFVDFDTTAAGGPGNGNGYYLFDNLVPGSYVVLIVGSNFSGAGALVGYNSSTPTGTENVGVALNPYTPNTDRDDNGVNNGNPTTLPAVAPGILSGTVTLAYNTEAASEAELSGQVDPGSPANLAFDPTGWDGPLSRGRWEEKDTNSNLTIDFGFIPVYSLGNRVWFDTNNNSAINGAEVGINNVRVQLFASDGTTEIPVGPDGILYTADDTTGGMLTATIGANAGYYLFNNLPAGDYIVKIPASNFGVGQPLRNTWSSGTTISNAGVMTETAAPDPDNDVDSSTDENGTRVTSGPFTGDIVSLPVTLGPGTPEPTTDSDPVTNPLATGEQPNNQSNRTVDFGFYTITLGNQVWGDTNNNGLLGGETGINGVTVQLWSQDLSTMLASTTTATVGPNAGIYSFTGLAAGNYVVRIPATNFNSGGVLQNYRSSTGTIYEPAPNPDTLVAGIVPDNDDNGTETGGNLGAGGYVQTSPITGVDGFALSPAAEQSVNNGTGLTTDNRVDFGFVQLVALGNRVWFDTGAGAFTNNGIMDAGEVGVDNVRIQLFTSAGVEVPVGPDGILGTADDALGGMLTSGGGYYSFDRLYPGTYYTFIPATQFQSGGPLFTYFSSAGADALEVRDEAVAGGIDENGIDDAAPATNGIRSNNFVLSIGGEQTGETQSNYTGTLPDANVNFTDDFGFVQKYSIGNRVWLDTDNSSTINGSEVGKDGVVVNLYAASNLAVILATDTTSGGGYYLFDDLYPGDYVVSVAASNFSGAGVLTGYWSSATSRNGTGALTETTAALANSDTESDDNGTRQTAGALNGSVISSTITLGPSGLTEPTGETDLEAVIGQGNQADGRANMTVDFGFYKLEIGNLVFADADVSGHFNAGDTLLTGVTVQLYAADGTTLITSTFTNGSGDYRFDGQPAGDYVIKVVTPTGMTSTIDTFDSPDNANPDVNTDMNDNGIGQGAGTVSSGVLTMTAGEVATNITITNATATTTDLTVDFGFVPLYSLGNRVWFDTNNNGLMDAGEVGVNGVTVQLYAADGSGNPTGAVLATDTTTGGGFYLFDDLFPGDYVVVIPASNFASGGALAGYWSSATNLTGVGAVTETTAPDGDTDATDADDNGTRVTSGAFSGAVIAQAVTLGPSGGTEPTGEVATQLESGVLGNQGNQPDDHANMTIDFGFYQVAIGNLVYLDSNGNGNYDSGTDSVIAGVNVRLYAANSTTGIPVGPDGILGTADDAAGGMSTSGLGIYRFSGLPAGDYIVKTVSPTGLLSTIDTFNALDTSDPDTNADDNDNGIGVGFGTISANTLTMAAGEVAANITVNNANGTTTDNTVDFGYIGMVAIGNRVWFDTGAGAFYNNGILDAGETGVSGLRVELYTSTGTFVSFTTTDASGYYQFDQLYPNTYYVLIPASEFQTGKPLETYYSTIGNGANETADQTTDENGIDDAAPATNGIRSPNYVLTSGGEQTGEDQSNYSGVLADNSVNFTADFGFVHLVAIGNRVWFDNGVGGGTLNDGIQNGSEAGAVGVRVELYTSGNAFVGFTTTDASGNYQFDNLAPGQYYVHIPASEFQAGGPLEDFVSSTGNGSDETSDQNVDENGIDAVSLPTTGISTPVYDLQPNTETTADDETSYTGYLTDDNVNFTADFGFLQKVAIGNVVWLDNGAGGGTANDGIKNGTEPGIPGVDVRLYNVGDIPGVDAPVATTTTGVNGYYVFDDLLPGDYFLYIPPTEFQSGGTLENYPSSTGNGSDETTNETGDENGIDDSAPAVNGIRSTNYTLQPNTEPTGEPQPNYTGALDDNNVNFTADFGFAELVAIGNRVWLDTGAGVFYNNGILDAGESGVNNVTVQLYTAAGVEVPVGPDGILGTGDDALGGVLTSAGGYYRFDRLYPGSYYVQIPSSEFTAGGDLVGYVSTLGAGANETSDNDADENGIDVATLTTTGIRTQNYNLQPNTEATSEDQTNYAGALDDDNVNFTADFGFVQLVSIGNRVWFDTGTGGGTADDGKQNGGELGASGVRVELYTSGNVFVAFTTTNASGDYLFDNLNPGQYYIHIPASQFQTGNPLEDYVSSTGNGTNETSDQDVDENGVDAVSLSTTGISTTVYDLQPNTETTADDETGYTGYLDDDNVNFTADLGFLQKVAIGNTVWLDNGTGGGTPNDGIQNGTEPGIQSVDVQLYHVGDTPGVTTPAATTTTDASGYYVFDNLLPGDYFVFIPATEFQSGGTLASYLSSTGNGTDETTDQTGDENGIDSATPATNGIRSTNYTLQPNSEQTGEAQPNYTGALDDDNVNFTADLGFVEKYSLGNRVWFDTNNDGLINGSEVGAAGVTVQLYAADVSGNPTGAALQTDTTVAGGYYLFDDLYAGDYVVVLPASNFIGAGVLTNYFSSGTTISPAGIRSELTPADADTDNSDIDDNGVLLSSGTFAGAVVSNNVVLGPTGNTEPTGETDLESGVGQGSSPDGRANMTVDFGFYTMSLGNLVWSDLDKNGAFNGSEAGIDGVTVELWSADGTTQLATTTTAGGGLYNFPGLAQGDYTVHVVAPTGTNSSVDIFAPVDTTNPTTNTDNNDNGVGTGSGTIVSNVVTLTPGNAQTSNTVTNATGTTTNPSLDFGFTPVFSLGNRVWFDTDNSGTINGTEVGINGVTVNLYAAGDLTTVIATQVTANGGYYLFNGLYAGDYVVSIASSNFTGVLSGYWSSATSRSTAGVVSETTANNADTNPSDIDDNGTLQTSGTLNGAVTSAVVTLGPGASEPSKETDLDGTLPGNQQGQPDAQANMTVDFGFYTITLGDIVWNDLDNSGRLDGAEVGIDGVTVEFRSGDGSTLLGSTTTAGGGLYTFTGLPTGDYIVRLPAINFNPGGVLHDFRSSTGPLPVPPPYEPAPDADTDVTNSDDNGSEVTPPLLGLGGYIQTLPVTLTPAGEEIATNATGTTLESRVDFGVFKGPQIDLKVTKDDGVSFYAAGGTLTYTIVVTNNGPADAGDPGTPTPGTGMTVSDPLPSQITSWTWTCVSALYGCDGGTGAPFTDELFLPQLASVTYTVVAQISPTATGDLTNSVTVNPPPGMTDLTPPDNTATDIDKTASLTVDKDDGVQIVAPGAVLTYTINVTNNGDSDLTGILLTDTIPTGTTFTSATGGGTFASGKVTWPLFTLAAGASTQRQVVVKVADEATLKTGKITSLTNVVDVEDDGSHTGSVPLKGTDTDIDQVLISNVKALIATNQAGSADPHTLIGEILTYTIRIDIPSGTINNLKALDLLDHGLAFVSCDATNPITSTGLTLQHNPCTEPSFLKVQAIPVTDTNPKSENAGRRVTFNFGQVQNTTGSTQTLLVTYQVVVLNIKSNVDGTKELNNKVTWTWEGGTLTGSATDVDIIEPDLSIKKTVDHEVASLGSTLTYKIEIAHTSKSTAPAYDVLVTDNIPVALLLDQTSIQVKNSSGLPTAVIKSTASQFTIYWASFPVGEKAVIVFKAKFVGPSPVINKANVVWSSIPIEPGPHFRHQSDFNEHSTERRYDPIDDTLNDYVTDSSVTVKTPEKLPDTGFAPGVQTILPVQPLEKSYDALGDLWLEIPKLGLKMPIVGVPASGTSWDLTWLSNQAGYLEGTTYPTQVGTTGLTGHVYLADGTPGPFIHLANLVYGDQVILHASGKRYIYEMRTSRVVLPTDLSVFKNDGYTWLTLLTCKDYISSLNKYDYRLAVRAVLVTVDDDPSLPGAAK